MCVDGSVCRIWRRGDENKRHQEQMARRRRDAQTPSDAQTPDAQRARRMAGIWGQCRTALADGQAGQASRRRGAGGSRHDMTVTGGEEFHVPAVRGEERGLTGMALDMVGGKGGGGGDDECAGAAEDGEGERSATASASGRATVDVCAAAQQEEEGGGGGEVFVREERGMGRRLQCWGSGKMREVIARDAAAARRRGGGRRPGGRRPGGQGGSAGGWGLVVVVQRPAGRAARPDEASCRTRCEAVPGGGGRRAARCSFVSGQDFLRGGGGWEPPESGEGKGQPRGPRGDVGRGAPRRSREDY